MLHLLSNDTRVMMGNIENPARQGCNHVFVDNIQKDTIYSAAGANHAYIRVNISTNNQNILHYLRMSNGHQAAIVDQICSSTRRVNQALSSGGHNCLTLTVFETIQQCQCNHRLWNEASSGTEKIVHCSSRKPSNNTVRNCVMAKYSNAQTPVTCCRSETNNKTATETKGLQIFGACHYY